MCCARSQPKLAYMKGTAPERAFPNAAQVEQVLYRNALTEQEYVKESSLLQRVQKAIAEIARGVQARNPAACKSPAVIAVPAAQALLPPTPLSTLHSPDCCQRYEMPEVLCSRAHARRMSTT
jgi:hypothetical protein